MPFIPHTDDDVTSMLQTIGVNSIDDLFDEIPKTLQIEALRAIPEGITEMALGRLLEEKAKDILSIEGKIEKISEKMDQFKIEQRLSKEELSDKINKILVVLEQIKYRQTNIR